MAHILLVEDDPWMADCYRAWLTAAGHTVTAVRDAQDALDAADIRLPNLVVLDLLLPNSSGVQLLHTMQSFADLAHVPVVLCSSSLPQDLPPLSAYGIVAALDKATLSPARLRNTVQEALQHAAV